MHDALSRAASGQMFTGSPTACLLLDDGLCIVAANDAYLARSQRAPEELLGRYLLDTVHDDPVSTSADGVGGLAASLRRVLGSGRPFSSPRQRGDLPSPPAADASGSRLSHLLAWAIVDDGGRVVGVACQADDGTPPTQGPGPPGGPDASGAEAAPSAIAQALALARRDHERLSIEHRNVVRAFSGLAGRYGTGGGDDTGRLRHGLWSTVIASRGEAGSGSWLESVCRAAPAALGDEWSSVVTGFGASGQPSVLVASDTWAYELDSLQEMVGEGPGVSARRDRFPVVVADLGTHDRWTMFGRLAFAASARSIVSLPLSDDDDVVVGTLTFFGRQTQAMGPIRLVCAGLLAEMAVSAMIIDATQVDDPTRAVELDFVARDGDDTAIAVGILAVRLGVTPAEASVRLRAHAFGTSRSLHDTAGAVVSGFLTLR